MGNPKYKSIEGWQEKVKYENELQGKQKEILSGPLV
jgi:hypothetical protein